MVPHKHDNVHLAEDARICDNCREAVTPTDNHRDQMLSDARRFAVKMTSGGGLLYFLIANIFNLVLLLLLTVFFTLAAMDVIDSPLYLPDELMNVPFILFFFGGATVLSAMSSYAIRNIRMGGCGDLHTAINGCRTLILSLILSFGGLVVSLVVLLFSTQDLSAERLPLMIVAGAVAVAVLYLNFYVKYTMMTTMKHNLEIALGERPLDKPCIVSGNLSVLCVVFGVLLLFSGNIPSALSEFAYASVYKNCRDFGIRLKRLSAPTPKPQAVAVDEHQTASAPEKASPSTSVDISSVEEELTSTASVETVSAEPTYDNPTYTAPVQHKTFAEEWKDAIASKEPNEDDFYNF